MSFKKPLPRNGASNAGTGGGSSSSQSSSIKSSPISSSYAPTSANAATSSVSKLKSSPQIQARSSKECIVLLAGQLKCKSDKELFGRKSWPRRWYELVQLPPATPSRRASLSQRSNSSRRNDKENNNASTSSLDSSTGQPPQVKYSLRYRAHQHSTAVGQSAPSGPADLIQGDIHIAHMHALIPQSIDRHGARFDVVTMGGADMTRLRVFSLAAVNDAGRQQWLRLLLQVWSAQTGAVQRLTTLNASRPSVTSQSSSSSLVAKAPSTPTHMHQKQQQQQQPLTDSASKRAAYDVALKKTAAKQRLAREQHAAMMKTMKPLQLPVTAQVPATAASTHRSQGGGDDELLNASSGAWSRPHSRLSSLSSLSFMSMSSAHADVTPRQSPRDAVASAPTGHHAAATQDTNARALRWSEVELTTSSHSVSRVWSDGDGDDESFKASASFDDSMHYDDADVVPTIHPSPVNDSVNAPPAMMVQHSPREVAHTHPLAAAAVGLSPLTRQNLAAHDRSVSSSHGRDGAESTTIGISLFGADARRSCDDVDKTFATPSKSLTQTMAAMQHEAAKQQDSAEPVQTILAQLTPVDASPSQTGQRHSNAAYDTSSAGQQQQQQYPSYLAQFDHEALDDQMRRVKIESQKNRRLKWWKHCCTCSSDQQH